MFKFLLVAILSTLFIGCSDSSSFHTQNNSSYLSPPSAPINSSLVPITQSISLEFSAVMDSSSFSAETLYIKDNNGDVISSTYAQNGDYIVILTPSAYFKMNTEYTVTVDVGIKDTDGRTLSKPYSFSFTTENSGGDTTSLTLELVKPLNSQASAINVPGVGSGNVDISSRLAIQFSKDIDPSKKPELVLEKIDDNGGPSVIIEGQSEVRGSVLILSPDTTPLVSNTMYELKIKDTTLVYDLYGNQYSGQSEWFFRTKMPAMAGHLFDSYNLSDMVGHKELATGITLKGKPIAATYSMSADYSQMFMSVVTDLGVELYNVNTSSKELTYNTTLTFPSEVKTIKSEGSEIIVGTAKDGVYIYKDDIHDNEVAFLEVFHYNEDGNMGAVYSVDSGWDSNTSKYYMAAVSPTTGLYIFETNVDGVYFFKSKVVKDASAFIDVDMFSPEGRLEMAVADYYQGGTGYYVDGTISGSIDVNGTTRHITTTGSTVYASTTLGISYDDTSNTYNSISGFPMDFFAYSESFTGGKNMLYGVDKDMGVEFIDLGGSYERSRVTLSASEHIVGAFAFKDMILDYSYLVVLGSNNTAHIFNAIPDIVAPYLSASVPVDGAMDQSVADTVTLVFSEILDITTINANNFSYTDEGGTVVPFDLTTNISGTTTTITLTPNGGEQSCGSTGCDVTLPAGIKDIVGNSSVEKTIHFTAY